MKTKAEAAENQDGNSVFPAVKFSLTMAALATALMMALFSLSTAGPLDFWWRMSVLIALLLGICFAADRSFGKFIASDFRKGPAAKILLGVLSAGLLYGIFFAANAISRRIFSFAADGINEVYSFQGGASPIRIGLLLGLIIGPGEELFWRGFLQRVWTSKSSFAGWLSTTGLYTAVHIGSGNIMLVMAAVACGLFWGALFLRTRSVLVTAISHTLWDILIFILFPLT